MRILILLLVIAAALCGASYAGGRLAVGEVVGTGPNGLGPFKTHFAFGGVPDLPTHPRAWVFSYPAAQDMAAGGAVIWVDLTGHLLGTKPADLAARVAARKPTEP